MVVVPTVVVPTTEDKPKSIGVTSERVWENPTCEAKVESRVRRFLI